MSQPRLSNEEIARQAESLYDDRIRADAEAVASNRGKIIVLDVDSGDYEIDDAALTAAHRLKVRHPEAELYARRIGYDAVYNLAGPLAPAKQ
jgi:hypothetical protein